MPPRARALLHRVLLIDQHGRDEIAALLRFRDSAGDDLADVIDLLTLHPDQRRNVIGT